MGKMLREVYKVVIERDKGVCQYCKKSGYMTFDHVIPKSKGGKSTVDNLVLACEECNRKKANLPKEIMTFL